jgi:glycosyltransferase involved in cell wall biosynthesis
MPIPYNHGFDADAFARDYPDEAARARRDGESLYTRFVAIGSALDESSYVKAPPSPTVTVVVPNFNGDEYLELTLSSVQRQTFQGWECIVVDDFSTDRSKEIVKRFFARDKRFRLVPHRANGGANAARNSGLRSARGAHLCFLDSDDLLMPTSLENRLSTILSAGHERLAGSYSASVRIDADATEPPEPTRVERMRVVDFVTAAGNCPFNINQPMFRTAVLRDLGGFDESMTQAEDWEFWIRILRHGYYLVPTHVADVTYRARHDSMVRADPLRHLSTGLAIHAAAHAPFPREKAFENAPYVYWKPWSEYKRQLDAASRVFQFCGMAVGAGHDSRRAVELAAAALPDYRGAIAPHCDVARHLSSGMDRQTARRGSPASRHGVALLAEEFLEAFRGSDVEAPDNGAGRPVQYGPTPSAQRATQLVFLPHKDYHVWGFSLIVERLRAEGISYTIVDPTYIYRDERARSKIDELGLPSIPYNELLLGEYRPEMVVCMNDWDPINRRIVQSCKELGIPTVGIVEGIQDYLDVDTGRTREPYRTVDYVVLPGAFDARYFPDDPSKVRVGGVPRVDDLLREEPAFPERPVAVINSNFTYNVLTDERDGWVRGAVEACRSAGVEYVISQHPADEGDFSDLNVSERSMYDLVRDGSVFISRFSSGILEALAMGKPAVYYNPHGELVDKFKEPHGAFPIAETVGELSEAIRRCVDAPQQYLAHADDYLELHVGVSRRSTTSAADLTAEAVLDIYRQADIPPEERRARLRYLLIHRDELLLGAPAPRGPWKRTTATVVETPGGEVQKSAPSAAPADRFQRKMRKLRRDPRAFFADAKLGPLRTLRHLFR